MLHDMLDMFLCAGIYCAIAIVASTIGGVIVHKLDGSRLAVATMIGGICYVVGQFCAN